MSQNPGLTSKLDSVEGLKELLGGGLFGRRAKKNHDLFSRASTKGVARASVLATRDYGDSNVYHVVAFSTGPDAIPEARLAGLREQAESIADELRTHGYFYYDTPTVWDGDDRIWISKKPLFRDLSVPTEGVYVFPLQESGTAGTPSDVSWAVVDGKLHIAVVSA
ncbi:hypothetical protein [Kitasatospora sp. GP82]|uniref:hypothetical protein n=1 Tax=Kitasatospora sp. GP82 TaxID=3035089 RepID=UPI0024749053|nr:hypothetical protein [Kitasatospora sp. GP82]MDH6125497.1 hypothetical protein [Kitasatospora sp. GP82]